LNGGALAAQNLDEQRDTDERLLINEWELQRLQAQPETFPDHITFVEVLNGLNFQPKHWSRLCEMKALRNEHANPALPVAEWEACVGMFAEECDLEDEDYQALLSCTTSLR
jgi:hypothetical protein